MNAAQIRKTISHLRSSPALIKLLYNYGWWRVLDEQRTWSSYMRAWFPRIQLLRACYSLLFAIFGMYIARNDTRDLVEVGVAFLAYTMLVAKVLTLYLNQEVIKEVYDQLEELCDVKRVLSYYNENVLERGKREVDVLYRSVGRTFALGFGLSHLFMFPYSWSTKTIPFRRWHMWDISYPPVFVVTYIVYGILSVFDFACYLDFCDYVLMQTIKQTKIQFQMLNYNLEHMKEIVLQKMAMKQEVKQHLAESVTRMRKLTREIIMRVKEMKRIEEDEDEVQREMEAYLKQCVDHYQTLLELSSKIQAVINFCMATQILLTAILNALLVFYITTISNSVDPMVICFGIGLVAFLAESFFYCYYAGELTAESSGLGFSVYASEWLTAREGFKRSMMIMIARSEKPVVLRGMGIPLSLRTFRAVTKVAYYLHALLINIYFEKKLNEKKH